MKQGDWEEAYRGDVIVFDTIRLFLSPAPSARALQEKIFTRRSSQMQSTHHNINIKPLTNMPRNMAMKRPHARIIRLVLQHHIPRLIRRIIHRLQQLHIAALRIDLLDGTVPLADALGDDPEVVPMEVHGVGDVVAEVVVEDDADGGVCAEVVDVPLGVVGVGGVALVGEGED